MKNYSYQLGAFFLFLGLVACGGGEATLVGENNVSEDSSLVSTTSTPSEETDTDIDTLIGISNSNEAEKERLLQEIMGLVEELRLAYDKMEEKNERYVEEVPLTSFLGNPVEVGELAIATINENFVRVHADYFDGSPVGGKRFFIHKGELLSIETLELKEKVTENGTMVVEDIALTFYYSKGTLLQIWDHAQNATVEENTIGWLAENIIDWELVKQQL